ncbi:MAG: hypothetical protein IJZ68_09375 [Bacteroidaceae bacterium]|nr:hypothetical protein [Bacteroidaceae bacterium]
MATFPEIHQEKCPYCGGQLKLVTAKYVWDYAYKCQKCSKNYPFKNEAPPDIKAVYDTEAYKNHAAFQKRKQEDDAAFKAGNAQLFVDYPPTSSKPAPLSGIFTPYICKEFRDNGSYGSQVTAITELQKYLNSHMVTRDRIVSINTAAYGGIVVITLVHT